MDPEVARLAGAGRQAVKILTELLNNHMDKGLKTNRLRRRYAYERGKR
jgi:hypothetical protein